LKFAVIGPNSNSTQVKQYLKQYVKRQTDYGRSEQKLSKFTIC